MATIADSITVSVEKTVHDALSTIAQGLFNKFGIQINAAAFAWSDNSSLDQRRMELQSLQVDTTTYGVPADDADIPA